jgi:hypothetical protein
MQASSLWWLFIFVVFFGMAVSASANSDISPDNVWQKIDEANLLSRDAERLLVPNKYQAFRLNKTRLQAILKNAPVEFTEDARNREVILSLPMPDGIFQRFRIENSPIVEKGLSIKYPELSQTYRGYGIDDPTSTVRFDFLPSGFHSMILSTRGTIMVDPYFKEGDTQNYISYLKSDVNPKEPFICLFEDEKARIDSFITDSFDEFFNGNEDNVISGSQLRQYRLALAATNEYAVAVGSNTIAGTLAAQVLVMNRVNGVYERDLAIRMNIIANNDLIVYAGDQMCGGVACTSANDPYTNSSGSTMLGENTTNLNNVITSANYDIGHVFSTGGGGVATLNGPCGANKARGVTGLTNPVGDPFAIDYVAHEMGHQWGSNHTFNGATSNCSGGNRSAANSYEPGSGVTIMAYAGICGTQNLARNSIDTFHVRSLEVIVAFSQTGTGNTCAQTTSSGNTPPNVSVVGGTSFNIPKQTPFALTASATDVDNDAITYDWQDYNTGGTTGTTAVPNTDADGTPRPLFRPYLPTGGGTRYFPSLEYILNNANVPPSTYTCNTSFTCMTGELLPAITRTMNFQVIARDNRANAGGINTATAVVNVDGNSGPFVITAPNTNVTFAGNSQQPVTWNVANTTASPVSAANVKISLSTDGGQTFPNVISASTANDGTETVTVPNVGTTTARIKVEAVNNIFFDISDANFTINPVASGKRFVDFDGDSKTDLSIFRPSVEQWWYLKSSDGGNAVFNFGNSSDILSPGDFTGDGKTDICFFRPSEGRWYVLRSEDSSFFAINFGANGDIPAPGDFDNDGKTDAAVFRPASGTWFILRSTDGGTTITPFGVNGDQPVVADYDGDGRDDVAIYRPSVGQWWLNRSTAGVVVLTFGTAADKTVQGDYTGDGKADIAFWRPTDGFWYILRSEDFSFFSFPFGTMGDVPVLGDYDGDGKFDPGIYRPSSNTWFINRSTSGLLVVGFGLTGDKPIPNAFVR